MKNKRKTTSLIQKDHTQYENTDTKDAAKDRKFVDINILQKQEEED